MRWSLYLFVCVALLARWGWAQESGWQINQVNATMCQWQEPRAAVIRDTVYIDGGYLYWEPGFADGTYGDLTHDGNPLGLVYRLNFSIPFNTTSNMTQIFSTISKAPNGGAANNFGPEYYDGAMFANDGEYYTYGGLVLNISGLSPQDSQSVEGYEAYWYGATGKQFTPGFVAGTLPSGVTRYVTAGGAVSVPSENMGFYFSGLRSASSGAIFYTANNESVNADVVSNTLISIDMSTERGEKWTNQTLPTNVPGRANPEIVWVPVSKQGVLIAIGGSVDPVFAYETQLLNDSQKAHDQAVNPGLMTTVSVYDIATGTWYNQPTTGQSPGALTQGCTVVASAQDDSSHNIYWYGGFDGIDESELFSDDVWILSVPSFKWMKGYSGNSTHGRAGHKCVKPYPDQMFVIGGYPSLSGNSFSCVESGIVQVFNLSSVTWMTSYDPAIWSNYSVPSMIYSTIGGNGTGGATQTTSSWANQSLATIFSTAYDVTKITKWYPYASQAANTTNPRQSVSPTPAPSSSGGGLPSWVAPVLGVVLGLVALSAILVFLLLWRRRRLFRQSGGSVTNTSDMNRYRIMSWVRGAEPKAPTVTSDESPSSPYDDTESPGDPNHVMPAEAAGTQVHEMADTSQPQELSATGMRYIPAVAALRPGLQGHTSHGSQSSSYSHGSKDSVSSRGAVSPVLPSSTPRPDSPSLGTDSRARFVSGVSATSSDYRALAEDPPSGTEAGVQNAVTPPEEMAESSRGLGVTSPISPPTPHGKEGTDYLSSSSSHSPQSPQSVQRKSNFGEML